MNEQPKNIRVLLVEDSADDALLTLRQLKQGGFAPDHLRVDARAALEQALRERAWDIVLCDYRMPGFDGAEALKVVQQSGQDLPFIIISGTIGEETAVAMMKAGAHDFLLKDALGRLVPAVERELREAGIRREKRQKEAALLKSEANLRKAEQIARLGNWEWNIGTGELTWSEEVYRLYGMDPAADTPSFDVVVRTLAPEDRERFTAAVDSAVKNSAPFEGEYRLIALNGTVRYTHTAGEVVRDGEGRPVSMFGIVRDITKQKLAEKALGESQKLLETIIESAPTCIKLLTADGSLQSMNRTGLDMIEAESLDQVRGKCVYPLVAEEHREAFEAMTREVFTGRSQTLEFKMIGLKGSPLWLYTHAVPIRNERGEIVLALATTTDITARKASEEKIRESEAFIRSILDTVDEGFIVIGRDYRIVTANRAYCGQVSLPCDGIIGRHCYEISHRANRPCYEEKEECAVRKVFETGESQTVLHKHTDRDGHILFVETKAFPIRDAAGAVVSAIETISNITEKHLLEEERLKTQKLESIGTLAGGIAHDFNNLLQGVFGYISMARMMYDEKEKSLAMLEQAEQAVHQSVNLTSQLLTFSKGGKPVKKILDLRPVIDNAAKFALSGSRSGFRLDMQPGLWRVDADGGQIGQVIQNIVLNADQAMPLGGRVTITARNLPPSEAASHTRLDRRDYIMISIEDQGVGIPETCLDKIFDPYFTTKEKGSGLGLATSYSIIRNHGGRIEVSSVVGKGTVFCICLPAVRTEAFAPVERPQPALNRPVRVLLMDDEEMICKVARELLVIMGHTVEFVMHGAAAIEKYRQAMAEGRPFDAVILDLTIRGGMGGAETLQALRTLDPGVKAIVSSGYSDDEVIATYRQHGFRAFLKKPYTIEDLGRALADAEA